MQGDAGAGRVFVALLVPGGGGGSTCLELRFKYRRKNRSFFLVNVPEWKTEHFGDEICCSYAFED